MVSVFEHMCLSAELVYSKDLKKIDAVDKEGKRVVSLYEHMCLCS